MMILVIGVADDDEVVDDSIDHIHHQLSALVSTVSAPYARDS